MKSALLFLVRRPSLLYRRENDEVGPSVFCPGGFVTFLDQRHFLAIADRLDSFLFNTQVGEVFGRFIRTLLAERQVVLHGSPLVAVTFHDQFIVLIFQIHRGGRLQDRLSLRGEVVFVVIEIDIGNLELFQNRLHGR